MSARNDPTSWGWVSRMLHWTMAAGLLVQLCFGLWAARSQPSFDNLWLFGFHKSLGITLLVLVLLRLGWHQVSPSPTTLSEGITPWQLRLAAVTHHLLYGLMIAVPLAGWAASSATGITTVVFGYLTLPRIAPVSEAWDRVGFTLHGWLALALSFGIALHVTGAAWRHWGHRDATLRRMLGRP